MTPAFHLNLSFLRVRRAAAAFALVTVAVLWRFKKVPEPVIVLVAALIGLVVYPLLKPA